MFGGKRPGDTLLVFILTSEYTWPVSGSIDQDWARNGPVITASRGASWTRNLQR